MLFHDLGTLIVGHGFGDALFKVVKFSFRGDDGWLDGAYFRLNVRLGFWLKVGRDILMNGVGFDRSFGGSGLGCRGHSYRLGGGCRSWFSCVPRLIFGLAGGSDFARKGIEAGLGYDLDRSYIDFLHCSLKARLARHGNIRSGFSRGGFKALGLSA